MSVEANKNVVRRTWEEAITQEQYDLMDELYAPQFSFHDPALQDRVDDTPEKMKQTVREFKHAFPDLIYHVLDLAGEEDQVVLRWRQTSTYTNQLFPGAPANGEKVDVTGIDYFRLEDGKIVEEMAEWDQLKMLQQIGVIPPMGPLTTSLPPTTTATGTSTSPQENKAVVQRYFTEVASQGNLESMDQICAANMLYHDPALPHDLRTSEDLKQHLTTLRGAFPDVSFNVNKLIAEGNTVVAFWTMTGTHLGQGLIPNLPPTGRQIRASGIDFLRVVDGKIVEDWSEWNVVGMLQQLGLAPTLGSDFVTTQLSQAGNPQGDTGK